jgi:hypothetical protein
MESGTRTLVLFLFGFARLPSSSRTPAQRRKLSSDEAGADSPIGFFSLRLRHRKLHVTVRRNAGTRSVRSPSARRPVVISRCAMES